MGRRRWRGGNGKGETGGGQGDWEKKGQEEEALYRWICFQAHGMPGWNEVTEYSD